MILDETVLRKVAEWQPPRGSRQTLVVPDEGSGWAVTLTADRNDELSSALWEVHLQRTAAAPAAVTLEGWAKGVAERVTGLLETLHVLEIDIQRREALLRSVEPTQRGDERFYYEVLLQGTQAASARRYRAHPGGARREQVAFVLTHEALAKFVRDLATV
ncbi:MAG TPA: hypothetical protein VKU02_08200 [Gemmataceae bacterium]|nr:hypothetical protein [Gemmataceae bacterium]